MKPASTSKPKTQKTRRLPRRSRVYLCGKDWIHVTPQGAATLHQHPHHAKPLDLLGAMPQAEWETIYHELGGRRILSLGRHWAFLYPNLAAWITALRGGPLDCITYRLAPPSSQHP